jgi:hypothetical protein
MEKDISLNSSTGLNYIIAAKKEAICMNNLAKAEQKNTYIVHAPPPTDPDIIPSIYWIEVAKDIVVEWLWTHLPDGNRVVTGYKLIPPASDAEAIDGGV